MPFPSLRRARPGSALALMDAPVAVVAASQVIESPNDLRAMAMVRQAPTLAWQYQALVDYDRCGLVHFADEWVSTMLSRLVYKAALIDKDGEPIVQTDGPLAEAVDALESRRDGRSEHFARMGGLDFLCGESWLVGTADGFEIMSVAELEISARTSRRSDGTFSGLFRVRFPGAPREPFSPTYLARIWRPHKAWYMLADSPHRSVMSEVDRICVLGDSIRAIAWSRITSRGAFVYPQELNDARRPKKTAGGVTVDAGTFGQDFIAIAGKAKKDPSGVQSTVPIPLGVPHAMADGVKFHDFATEQDRYTVGLRREAKESYAEGVMLPLETLMGKGDLNHWNYGGVTADEFRHLEGPAGFLCDAVARAYLRPLAKLVGIDPRMVTLTYDASQVIIPPDRSALANEGHDRLLISNEAWRGASSFVEDDAPSEEEYRQRISEKIVIAAARGNAEAEQAALEDVGLVPIGSGVEPSSASVVDGSQAVTPLPAPGTKNAAAPVVASLVAAAKPLAGLGRRLYEIDLSTREAIAEMCDMAMSAALRRAGGKVMSAVRMRTMKDRLAAKPLDEVAAELGRAAIAQLGLTEDLLVAGAFAELATRAQRRMKAAQRSAASAVRAEGDFDEDGYDAKADTHRAAAGVLLVTLMTALAHDRLYNPHPAQPAQGEVSTTGVPATLVAAVMARAGGADVATAPNGSLIVDEGRPTPGIASGPLTLDAFSDAVAPMAWQRTYTWHWSGSERPFEPHENLEGVTWTDDDLSPLVNNQSWPDVPFFYAGDHDGCFPAGVIVSGPVARGSTLRWYEGEMVELTFASGEFLPATPNHPILTAQGWVAAGLLNEGDEVIRCMNAEGITALVPDECQVPAPIEDVADSFGISAGVVPRSVPVAPEHFHGDGVGSQVAVVRAHGRLVFDRDAALGEPHGQEAFTAGDRLPTLLSGAGGPGEHLGRVGDSPLGGVSSLNHSQSFLGSTPGALEELLFGSSPQSDSRIGHEVGELPAAGPEFFAETLEGFAGHIASDDNGASLGGPSAPELAGLPGSPNGHAQPAQSGGDGSHCDSELSGDIGGGLTGLVSTDKVIGVRRNPRFTGHVRNLQTRPGWYTANGVIVHNCGCGEESEFELVEATDANPAVDAG